MIVKEGSLPVYFQGTIIDLETTGLSTSDSVITLGILSGSGYKIFQSTDDSNLLDCLKPVIQAFRRPIYAFNKGFEEAFLGLEVDVELQNMRYERKSDAIHISGLEDPFDGSGRLVPLEWSSYLQDRKSDHLQKIITHNEADLLSELCLAIVRSKKPSTGES